MKRRVAVSALKPGMFVEELDRPWIETPYPIEGILIRSKKDIEALAQYCQYVHITEPEGISLQSFKPRSPLYLTHIIPTDTGAKTPFHGNHAYMDAHPIEKELPMAKEARKKATILIHQIRDKMNQDLRLDVTAAKQLIGIIATSIIRNPAAMMLLNDLQQAESGDYLTHAINNATYMIAFGRHLCLPPDELSILGLGGLLMDIGLLQLKKKLPRLNTGSPQEEGIIFSEHVKFGEKILSKIPDIPREVIDITAQHHEREDQSGYPRGLAANQITPYARMAAIVDCYERMITEGLTSEHPILPPFEALELLWRWTQRWLNASLVQQFAHCIGLFPIGSLVELNTGEVAIVLSHNRIKRLLPKVMVILDSNKQPYETPWTLDLASSEPDSDSSGTTFKIVRALDNQAYGIHPREYYL